MLVPSCRRRAVSVFVLVAIVSAAPPAWGQRSNAKFITQTLERVGVEVVTVGAPGNRAALPSEMGYGFSQVPPNMGRVDYEYSIGRTHVTKGQWTAFLNAYAPFHEAAGGPRGDHTMATGYWWNPNTSQPANYQPFSSKSAATAHIMSWHMAARFSNWMHHGAPDASKASHATFTTGAYDASTFGQTATLPNGAFVYTEQWRRSEGARFWIPSLDEWIKAAHYDPNRYGEGQEGYWMRHGSQNEPLIPGPPELGGETNAGNWQQFPGYDYTRIPSGSYPHIQSPWGMLDGSGMRYDWVEDPPVEWTYPDGTMHVNHRYYLGSAWGDYHIERDLIDYLATLSAGSSASGFRIATIIPSPGAALPLSAALALAFSRRRRTSCDTTCSCARCPALR